MCITTAETLALDPDKSPIRQESGRTIAQRKTPTMTMDDYALEGLDVGHEAQG